MASTRPCVSNRLASANHNKLTFKCSEMRIARDVTSWTSHHDRLSERSFSSRCQIALRRLRRLVCVITRPHPAVGQMTEAELFFRRTSCGLDFIFASRDSDESRHDDPGWWSQTGSNRRPPACKAGALPTELWPRTGTHAPPRPEFRTRESLVGLGRLELPTSRLSSARSNQLSYKPEHGPTDRPPCTTAQHAPTDAKRHGLVREEREKKTAVSRLWGL
jgi:hypothetical protein